MSADKTSVAMHLLEVLAGMQGKEVEVTEDRISFKRNCDQYGVVYDDFQAVNSNAGVNAAINAFTARILIFD